MKPNIEAEQAVIGGIVLDAEKVFPLAVSQLTPDDFYTPEYKTLFAACLEIWRDRQSIDAVTLIAKAGARYRDLILTAAQNLPALSHAAFYVQAVKTTAQKIRASEGAQELVIAIEEESVEECRARAAEITRQLMGEKQVSSCDAKAGFLDFVDRAERQKNYLKTGFYKVDRSVRIAHGDYIVIGGNPSSGKTALTLQMLLSVAKQEKAIYFSLETSKEKIMDRLVCSFTRTPFDEIKEGKITTWDAITAAYDEFKQLDFEIVEAAGWTVGQVEAYTIQRGAKVIFIDYLSILKGQGKSLYERVSNISMDLHTLAQHNKITVFALSQLRRNDNKTPSMEDLRESGQIEQDADCIMLLHTVDPNEQCSDRELIVAKNKEGPVGKMVLSFHGQIQTFYQREDDRYGR